MKPVFVDYGNTQSVQGDETNIINRREIMPLLAKAREVLRHYEKAMDCSAAVLDNSGIIVETLGPPAEVCVQHFPGNECPCGEIHQAALAESRRTEGVYAYNCTAGFVFWTSPLYRNGRYAGALLAGGVPGKNYEEIKPMAEMLGLCAEEISERKEDASEMIRRKAWQNMNSKSHPDSNLAAGKEDSPEAGCASSGHRRGLLERERMLLAAFRRGDNETGGRILKELMGSTMEAMPGNLEVVRFRAIELVVLLSRASTSESPGKEPASDSVAADSVASSDAMLEINNRYLSRILESNTAEELVENLQNSAERMSSKIFSFQGMRHASALRRAERYIWENYTRKLSLDEIAKASGLSAPYFSTIFKEEMGENLSSYLNRLRVERTVTLLMETGKPLNEIAKLCGFEDQSWFSKIFKSFTGISPGKFREKGGGNSVQKPEKDQGEITSRQFAGAQTSWRAVDRKKKEKISS